MINLRQVPIERGFVIKIAVPQIEEQMDLARTVSHAEQMFRRYFQAPPIFLNDLEYCLLIKILPHADVGGDFVD